MTHIPEPWRSIALLLLLCAVMFVMTVYAYLAGDWLAR